MSIPKPTKRHSTFVLLFFFFFPEQVYVFKTIGESVIENANTLHDNSIGLPLSSITRAHHHQLLNPLGPSVCSPACLLLLTLWNEVELNSLFFSVRINREHTHTHFAIVNYICIF